MSLDVKATSAMSPHESPARAVRVGCTPSGNELDRVLVARIALNDRAAFEQLYLRYHQRISRFVTKKMTRRTELADEIGNDTFAYHFGKSCEEIAASLGCPVSTVKTRMFYGRQKLKRLLPILAGRASADHS